MLSDTGFVALNAIYLKKTVTAAVIADVTALPAHMVSLRLAAAADEVWIMNLPTGAMLLTEGTEQVLAYYRDAYASVGIDPSLIRWYKNFETLNMRFIAAVREWQHSEGDERVERYLLEAAKTLVKDIGQLIPKIPRYAATYTRRLERSMDRVHSNLRDFVCMPTVDSMHNLWFEFHEDILAVLGRPRDAT